MYLIELTMSPSRILVRRGLSRRGVRTYSKAAALVLRWPCSRAGSGCSSARGSEFRALLELVVLT